MRFWLEVLLFIYNCSRMFIELRNLSHLNELLAVHWFRFFKCPFIFTNNMPAISRKCLKITWLCLVMVHVIYLQHKNSQVNFQLWREAQAYGDMQLMPFVDYYSLISLKTIAICTMGVRSWEKCASLPLPKLLLSCSTYSSESSIFIITITITLRFTL